MADSSQPSGVTAEKLLRWSRQALAALGVPPDQAEVISASLVDSDLRGVHSHGVRLLATYSPRVKAGDLAADTRVSVVRDVAAMALLDGGLGFGQVAAEQAIHLATDKAEAHGVAVVAVRETTHFGALGYFTAQAAQRGMIAIGAQNGPPMVPAYGGLTRLFATNPRSYAVPVAGEEPLVFDVATTAVAGNRVQQARARGETTIPLGWMTDSKGRPTQDAAAAADGFLEWAGGHKGYGLGLLVEILAGVFADGPYGNVHNSQSAIEGRGRLAKGGTFIVINPNVLLDAEVFAERMRALVDEVRASEPAADVTRVLVPGDLERERAAAALALGIELEASTREVLAKLSTELGVAPL